jgi:hypothetical protein
VLLDAALAHRQHSLNTPARSGKEADMEAIVERLVACFERGALSMRQVIAGRRDAVERHTHGDRSRTDMPPSNQAVLRTCG